MNEKIIVECVVCGKQYEIKRNRDYRIRLKSGLFYCSKECTWSKNARKIRAKWQATTMKEKYGYENVFQRKDVIKKIHEKKDEIETQKNREKTFFDRYGARTPQQVKEINKKTQQTNLIRYGVKCICNSPDNIKKQKKRNKEKYGCEYFFQSEKFKALQRKTMLERYGTEKYFKFGSNEFKSRMVELYGVENPMHIPEIAERIVLNYYQTNKFYILPSGKKIRIQGYENKTLDKLFKLGYNENDIKYRKKDMPEFWYKYEGKRRRYYPDFYIKKENLIMETKSYYTLKLEEEQNNKKFSAVKEAGYNFRLDVY